MPASRIQQVLTAQRRKKLVEMRAAGASFEDIAEKLQYASRQAASRDMTRVLEIAIAEAAASAEIHREMELTRLDQELQRLDALYDSVLEVMEREHVTVSNGRVVELGGAPVPDDAPVLAAIDRLLKIEESRRRNGERRAKLLGLEAPQAMEVSISELDRQIADAERQLALAGEAEASATSEESAD